MPLRVYPEVTVRAPWPDEIGRLREWLPRAFVGAAPPAGLTVAVGGSMQRFVAAAACSDGLFRWRVAAPAYEEAALLTELFARALAGREQAIEAFRFVDAAGPEAASLRAVGFCPAVVQESYETPAAPLAERLAALRERLAARGVIPPDAAVTAIAPADLPAARDLLARHLPAGARQTGSPLETEHEAFRLADSTVLRVGGAVRGLMLCRRIGPLCNVGAVVIDAGYRGGFAWANALLLAENVRLGLQTGLQTIRFSADETLHPNSVSFARHLGAASTGAMVLFRRSAGVNG